MRASSTSPLSTAKTEEIKPQDQPEKIFQVAPIAIPVMLEPQLQGQPRPSSLPDPQTLSRSEPLFNTEQEKHSNSHSSSSPVQHLTWPNPPVELGNDLMAAVEGGQHEKVTLLLSTLDPKNDKHFNQALAALRAAIGLNCVPVATSCIDWFKKNSAFDAEEIFPFERQLKTFSDQELLCLASAGYEFSYEYFPRHCDYKTVSAIQDILYGEGLQKSPLSRLSSDSARSSEELWICIARCGMLDENANFDSGITESELMLHGFRRPVAIWLAELLRACSPVQVETASFEEGLSGAQSHLYGLMLLNAMQSPPPEMQSTDPLVSQQCQLLAKVAQHCIQLRFDSHENFFRKCLSCLKKDFSIDEKKLKNIFRYRLGLPDVAIKQIASAIEQCLNLPLNIAIKPGVTAKQVQEEIIIQTRLSLLRLLPAVLFNALQSAACSEDINTEVKRHGKVFEVFPTLSISRIKQLCQQMQIMIDSGEIENIELSSSDETSGSDSDSDSDANPDPYR